MTQLYLGEAFGWQTDSTAKVALSQLQEKSKITKRCPKAQLIQAQSHLPLINAVKILGYIPVLNILAGGLAIYFASEGGNSERPHNREFWILRGVCMILFGPLLAIADLIKTICNETIAKKFCKENPELIAKFNTSHAHNTPGWWPAGQPVRCPAGQHVRCNGTVDGESRLNDL